MAGQRDVALAIAGGVGGVAVTVVALTVTVVTDSDSDIRHQQVAWHRAGRCCPGGSWQCGRGNGDSGDSGDSDSGD